MEEDDDLSWPEDLESFAAAWMEEVRSKADGCAGDFGSKVVAMNFLGSPETQWTFLRAAVAAAGGEDELVAIAAGPFEHLLAHHGADYIGAVEEEARRDARFARMTTHSWRHAMSDEVWARVQAIQRAAAGAAS